MTALNDIQAKLPKTCRILAVSKLQAPEKILQLYQQGQRLFAENYAQEASEKMKIVDKADIEWHFIGRLQKNKVKQVVGRFQLIHSVDSFELAKAIDQQAQNQQEILVQVNLAGEASKAGVTEADLAIFLSQCALLSKVKVRGLMTMPPLFSEPEKARPYFQKLKKLQVELSKKFPSLTELSMGTSADFCIAASEGATIVRLGTILFGERVK
jgi:PLP dependent protein